VFVSSGAFHDRGQAYRGRPFVAIALLFIVMSPIGGCSQTPSRIEAPDWDPPALAERILSELDKNGDAHVDAQEWAVAPGLAAGARYIDRDKDGRLGHDEIEARFDLYRDLRIGIRQQSFQLTYKGRPVAGAETVFVPEPFLDGVIEPARGTTDQQGIVAPQTEGQDLLGMRTGYYRVQITSPHVNIPTRYNSSATTLGAEVSPRNDDPFAPGLPELRLTD